MNPLDRLSERRRALRAWRQARTLAELGELTAAWLEGTIASHPGYHGRPDPETDELVPALAALNRAGLVTICSQPGVDDVGVVDGVRWSQRGAVEALADDQTARRVQAAAERAGLIVIHHGPAARWRSDTTRATPVTVTGDHMAVTDFGAHHSRRGLGLIFAGCSADAFDAVCTASQITVIDPDWGRNDRLWPLLIDAVDATPADSGRSE